MSYEYDIFLSYKRSADTIRWIEEHFQPLLKHAVDFELGRDTKIFWDSNLPEGGSWPLALGQALGSSRIILPIWTKNYFNSDWCVRELSLMLDRERITGRRTPDTSLGMIVPVVIHDCESLEPSIDHIQRYNLSHCYNPRMSREGGKAETLYDNLKDLAPSIGKAIDNAPDWMKEWPQDAADQFMSSLLRSDQPRQTTLPRFSP